MTEFELKFLVPPAGKAGVESALGLAGARRQRLQAAYFDTADGRLCTHRLSLRLRKEGRGWMQTLKAPGESAVHRLEHNVARPGRFGPDGPALDISLHAGTPAGDALKALLAADEAGVTPGLQVVYRADVWRRTVLMDQQGTRVEAALDEGTLQAGDQRVEVSELEFELVRGDPADVVALAGRVALPQGLWLSTISKAERGELLARGRQVGPAVHARAPEFDSPRPTAPALLRAALGACLEQVLPNASMVASGQAEAEHIHQLRVGLRRLRTALRELGSLSRGVRPEWDAALARTFSALGEVRDRETVAAGVADRLAAAGAPAVAPPSAGEAVDLAGAVRDAGFQTALLEILALASARPGPETGPEAAADEVAAPKPRRTVRRRLQRLHQQICRDAARFEQLPEEQQHRVRKRLKRLRYLSELVAGLFGQKPVDKFLAALRPAQEALGEYNDLLVARDMYRQAAAQGQPAAWFAVGWLSAQVPSGAKGCRKSLSRVADAPVFW